MEQQNQLERFTVKEAAEYLGVSTAAIYKMVREKQIPHFRVRSIILFSKDAIDGWVAQQEKESMNESTSLSY
jgi:excisionase family DNA binding protein